MRLPANLHRFKVYRAQFRSELPLLPTVDTKELGSFLIHVLREASRERLTRSFRNWVVGNLEPILLPTGTYVYGRIGRLHRNRFEHFSSSAFEEITLETSESVAFVFHQKTELTCVESKPRLTADEAVRRLMYIFDHASEEPRRSQRLTLNPVEDREQELLKLQHLTRVIRFSARLQPPNPFTGPRYQKWWSTVHGNSAAKRVSVVWDGNGDALNLDDSSPITRAIEMAADAYGTWRADGFDKRNRKHHLDSGDNAVRFPAPFRQPHETVFAVDDFIRSFSSDDGTTFDNAADEAGQATPTPISTDGQEESVLDESPPEQE